MRRSKMEIYLDILKVLAQNGPLKLTHMMYKANVNCCVLKDYVDFLIKQELIKEKTLKKEKISYTITEKGLDILRKIRELELILPCFEEDKTRIPPMLY